jgi:hypothetical protein
MAKPRKVKDLTNRPMAQRSAKRREKNRSRSTTVAPEKGHLLLGGAVKSLGVSFSGPNFGSGDSTGNVRQAIRQERQISRHAVHALLQGNLHGACVGRGLGNG